MIGFSTESSAECKIKTNKLARQLGHTTRTEKILHSFLVSETGIFQDGFMEGQRDGRGGGTELRTDFGIQGPKDKGIMCGTKDLTQHHPQSLETFQLQILT